LPTAVTQAQAECVRDNPAQPFSVFLMTEHFDRLARPACSHINIRAQKLDIVFYLFGHGPPDPPQRFQRIIELILLEVNAGEPERGFISYGIINGAFEYPLDGAPCAVVHAVVELEIAN